MKIYLEQTDDGRRIFRADGLEDDEDLPLPGRGGVRGWLVRRLHALKHSFHHPKSGLAQRMRRVWDWLRRRMHPDEPLLIRLRTAHAIEVHHPASLSTQEARSAWSDYLARRLRRYLPWLILNALLAPLTVLLVPLPGPNLIGYWIAYRAVRDLLAILGVRRALSGRVEATFHGGGGRAAVVGSADGTRQPCDS
ncbi:MAG TPA: hypothetical protein VKP69_34800 [Isosphaeraceae bacterium]|nr:hypothetical protein [Isosphaeraceae bacterium]